MVIQKTTQIMMERLRQILAVDAVSCSQVIIEGARVGAANCYNVELTYIVGHVCRMIDRINVCVQILWHFFLFRERHAIEHSFRLADFCEMFGFQ